MDVEGPEAEGGGTGPAQEADSDSHQPKSAQGPRESALQGYAFPISSLLDPTRVVMDATMSNVRELRDGFLAGCSSLEKVDLSGLSNVQKVGRYFLHGCESLKEVDLSPLCNVQEVGDGFLDLCSSLQKVDLSPLSNVQKVGHNFLFGCSSLKEVDLSPLSHVQEIGLGLLSGCSSLTKVILTTSTPGALGRALQHLPVCMQTGGK